MLSWQWDFGDGRTSESPRVEHSWSSPGFYEVTLLVSDGEVESAASLTFLVEAAEPDGTCEPDDGTLCLRNSRYAVEVQWQTMSGDTGTGTVTRAGTNEAGLFWFFDADNWELLIKVLDGCTLNGHHWVFKASTTDVGYIVSVTDTLTGIVKEYRNDPGRAASATTDTTAFEQSCSP